MGRHPFEHCCRLLVIEQVLRVRYLVEEMARLIAGEWESLCSIIECLVGKFREGSVIAPNPHDDDG